jgi:hypothetical protein
MRRAASLAACTAGNNNATNTPIMAITTNNSTNVKPVVWLLQLRLPVREKVIL